LGIFFPLWAHKGRPAQPSVESAFCRPGSPIPRRVGPQWSYCCPPTFPKIGQPFRPPRPPVGPLVVPFGPARAPSSPPGTPDGALVAGGTPLARSRPLTKTRSTLNRQTRWRKLVSKGTLRTSRGKPERVFPPSRRSPCLCLCAWNNRPFAWVRGCWKGIGVEISRFFQKASFFRIPAPRRRCCRENTFPRAPGFAPVTARNRSFRMWGWGGSPLSLGIDAPSAPCGTEGEIYTLLRLQFFCPNFPGPGTDPLPDPLCSPQGGGPAIVAFCLFGPVADADFSSPAVRRVRPFPLAPCLRVARKPWLKWADQKVQSSGVPPQRPPFRRRP